MLHLPLIVLFITCSPVDPAPDGFTALFNGVDLTGWQGLVGNPVSRAKMPLDDHAAAQAVADERMRAHWQVEGGILIFDGAGDSLCTADDYGDVELYLDWKIEPGGDSGIYLRGTPQVQIWDHPLGSGGLYNNQRHTAAPLVAADRPPGRWNRFHILMHDDTVTVWLNDQLVVDQTPLENYWARGAALPSQGQIELQSHNRPLYFREIFVRKIESPNDNAESARGPEPGPFQDPAWGPCTAQPLPGGNTRLNLQVDSWPDGPLLLPGLRNEVISAHLVMNGEPGRLPVRRNDDGILSITLPAVAPDPLDRVVRVDIAGVPALTTVPEE